MAIKKHIAGGTLRIVMAEEIKKQLAVAANGHPDQYREVAAIALGITPRTLKVWLGPIDKGGWSELQGFGGMEKLLKTKAKTKKKAAKKKAASKPSELAA